MVLCLQKIKFFFYPITRFTDCEFEGLSGLRGTLQTKNINQFLGSIDGGVSLRDTFHMLQSN